jgi:hypothetical protein
VRLNFVPVVLLLALAGCQAASAPAPSCPLGTTAWDRVELFFGRVIPGGGTVSETDWQAYVQEVLSPAFPDGLTVLEGQGRWLSPTGEHFVENSFVVFIFLPADSTEGQRVDDVTAVYKGRFKQEAVLYTHSRACLAFK